MSLKYVVAMIREDIVEIVVEALRAGGIPGVTVTEVKGYGEYANSFEPNALETSYRLEIFAREELVADVKRIIKETSQSGSIGDGFIGVLPMESLLRIRDGKDIE